MKNAQWKIVSTCLLALMASVAVAADEKWEMTTKMDMPGMPIPAQTNVVCIPKDGAYQAGSEDKNTHCQTYDVKTMGSRMTWKMRCTGKEEMTGAGDQTRTATSMSGTMTMTTHGETMTSSYTGKLLGSCDAAAERGKQEAALAKMQADSNKQMCDGFIESSWQNGGREASTGDLFRKDCAGAKADLCAKATPYVATYKGYSAYAKSHGWVATTCGINLDKQRATLCAKAGGERKFDFIGHYCPADAKALADKNCKGFGRDYTADSENPNRDMCKALRGGGNDSDSSDNASSDDDQGQSGNDDHPRRNARNKSAPSDKPADAASTAGDTAAKALDAAKKLKGMFGF
jgi:hypothetical protein